MSIDISGNEMLRSARTLMSSAAAGVPCEGQALALRVSGVRFFSYCGGRHAYTNAMQVFLHRLPCPAIASSSWIS